MVRIVALVFCVAVVPAAAAAQTSEKLTFEAAIQRAIEQNPTVAQAAEGILRAQAILQQVGASSRPSLDATFNTTVIAPLTEFSGTSIVPRTQTQTAGSLAVPLLTPVAWAQRAQAADQVFVSRQTVVDIRRQVAVATAEAYLRILTFRRVQDLNERARDSAREHYDFANQRFQGGIGSRLNMLRAQQELTSDEARVEEARLGVRRAQEALGVLVAVEGPIDTADEPSFDVPTDDETAVYNRADLQLLVSREAAAQRVLNDSWRDRLPSITALFAPQIAAPAGLFANSWLWRGSVLLSVPVFDSGYRAGLKSERLALLNSIKFERAGAVRQATSEIRAARDAIGFLERASMQARQAAELANEVVRITDVAFREGATTNLELLDAQRQARDVDTQAVIAQDAVQRARLDLLVALGRFPR